MPEPDGNKKMSILAITFEDGFSMVSKTGNHHCNI